VKRPFLLLIALSYLHYGLAQKYEPADSGSSVTFTIKNMGFTVEGSFSGLKGSIFFDPNELVQSKFDITINARSIDTGIDLRNKHLKKEEYFDVIHFNEIHFISTEIVALQQPNKFEVAGKLTIKGITKQIKFMFKAQNQGTGYLFTGEFSIDRRDFGIGSNSLSIADDVKVFLSVTGTLVKT
jgi:polyisoprenoid-binding protein YceI